MGSRFLNISKDLSPVAKVKASNTYDSCARTDKKSVPSVSGDSLEPWRKKNRNFVLFEYKCRLTKTNLNFSYLVNL
jgi:hypothetical protein